MLNKENNMLKEPRYLKKIRNKKGSKNPSDVFSSLTEPMPPVPKNTETPPPLELKKPVPLPNIPKLSKIETRFKNRNSVPLRRLRSLATYFRARDRACFDSVLEAMTARFPEAAAEFKERNPYDRPRKIKIKKIRSKKRKARKKSRYETYINSSMWASIKNRYWQNNPRKCAACSSMERIHLHHGFYAERGSIYLPYAKYAMMNFTNP